MISKSNLVIEHVCILCFDISLTNFGVLLVMYYMNNVRFIKTIYVNIDKYKLFKKRRLYKYLANHLYNHLLDWTWVYIEKPYIHLFKNKFLYSTIFDKLTIKRSNFEN